MLRAGINGGGIGGLAPAIVIRGAGFGQHDAGATVKLADDSTHDFDLMIGADGIHSGVRKFIFAATAHPDWTNESWAAPGKSQRA